LSLLPLAGLKLYKHGIKFVIYATILPEAVNVNLILKR
jgi:hypothetical protein